MPNCPECVFKKRNVIIEEHKDDEDVNLNQLLDEVEVLMKFDPVTKHFICKRCGLYATREQVGDIRERINRKESTREDKQYDYLSWWQKSRKLEKMYAMAMGKTDSFPYVLCRTLEFNKQFEQVKQNASLHQFFLILKG